MSQGKFTIDYDEKGFKKVTHDPDTGTNWGAVVGIILFLLLLATVNDLCGMSIL